jgi:hypothetical protein
VWETKRVEEEVSQKREKGRERKVEEEAKNMVEKSRLKCKATRRVIETTTVRMNRREKLV